jgi:hypothetical protein
MSHLSTTARRRRLRPAALLAVGVLSLWTLAGCSSGDDTSSNTPTTPVTASSGGDTEALAAACREADLGRIEEAAAGFAAADASLNAAVSEAEATSAFVTLLDEGSVLFSAMASSLEGVFEALADATGEPALADLPDALRSAADDFSTLATDVSDAGTISEVDVTRIDEITAELDEIGAITETESEGGQQLRRVPACETFLRNFEAIFTTIEGDGGDVPDSGGGVNSDPSDGACDQDRWLEDPDCGDNETINSDLADGACDESRFYTDPDC